MTVAPPLAYCEHGYSEGEHCRTCEIMGICKPCTRAKARAKASVGPTVSDTSSRA